MNYQDVKNVAIIGAGVAGIATAKALHNAGIPCKVFEKSDRLGGVWARGYPNFGVQVQKELYEYPDAPLAADVPNFTPGPIFQSYLEDYAIQHGVSPADNGCCDHPDLLDLIERGSFSQAGQYGDARSRHRSFFFRQRCIV